MRLDLTDIESEMDNMNVVMLFKYMGDAYFELEQLNSALRHYDMALEYLQPGIKYPKAFTAIEIKFMKYKVYCRLKKYSAAYEMLAAVPKADHIPKTRLALAKLHSTRLNYSKNTAKSAREVGEIVANYDAIVTTRPCAYHCISKLYFFGSPPSVELNYDGHETTVALFKAKALRLQLVPLEALRVLRNTNQKNIYVVLESAELYSMVGDFVKSKFELERLLTLNPYGLIGMDLLARVYYKLEKEKEKQRLETLLLHCLHVDENAPETYVTFGYLARGRRDESSQNFVGKALSAYMCGPDRCNALILKATLHTDIQRKTYADECLRQVLTYDPRNVEAMEMLARLVVMRKSSNEVRTLGESIKQKLGLENPRAKYVYAHTFTNTKPYKPEYENLLEDVVNKAPYLFVAVLDYATLLEERGDLPKAIMVCKRGIQACPTLDLHETLGMLEEKLCNEVETATVEMKYPTTKVEPEEPTTSAKILNPSRVSAEQTTTTPVSTQPGSAQRTRPPAAPRRQRQGNFRSVALEFIQQPLEFQEEPEAMPQVGDLVFEAEDAVLDAELERIMDEGMDPDPPLMQDLDPQSEDQSMSDN
ncbi:unnamed protein product [Bursaphelenchus okinawaensis]|uniref:TPR_REGION domain-containing protein n=1 Tax=Bursaphelenchus okinawaensis TaxID=465554 RepID=A0A811L151_9BILA|nr:unnamed protein product [Bursaphelenchus okinawaensis]CAG9114316.1 unnamed protein product [Bursaphelenchus okinawaensis]